MTYIPGEPYEELYVAPEAIMGTDIGKMMGELLKEVHRLRWLVAKFSYELGEVKDRIPMP